MTLALISIVAAAWVAVALVIALVLGRVSAAGEHRRSMDELGRERQTAPQLSATTRWASTRLRS